MLDSKGSIVFVVFIDLLILFGCTGLWFMTTQYSDDTMQNPMTGQVRNNFENRIHEDSNNEEDIKDRNTVMAFILDKWILIVLLVIIIHIYVNAQAPG